MGFFLKKRNKKYTEDCFIFRSLENSFSFSFAYNYSLFRFSCNTCIETNTNMTVELFFQLTTSRFSCHALASLILDSFVWNKHGSQPQPTTDVAYIGGTISLNNRFCTYFLFSSKTSLLVSSFPDMHCRPLVSLSSPSRLARLPDRRNLLGEVSLVDDLWFM